MHKAISRVLLSAALIVPLAACESLDPSGIIDLIPDAKKKLPGERKPVFPEGVPGVPQGVPPELVKGNQPPAEAATAEPPKAAEAPPEEEPKPKPKPRRTASPKPQQQPQPQAKPAQAAPPAQNAPAQAGGWPAAPRPAQPPAGSSNQLGWPAPPPTGTFSR